MTHVCKWTLPGVLLVAVAFAVSASLLHPSFAFDATGAGDMAGLLWVPVLPTVLGIATAALVSRAVGRRGELDERARRALEGHPVVRELGWLAFFFAAFVASSLFLTVFFGLVQDGLGDDLALSGTLVARLLFLFLLPLVIMDRSGVTVSGQGTEMPALALAVREPWRWLGLVPASVSLAVVAYGMLPGERAALASLFLLAMLGAFLLIVVTEEIFFRGMIQTRLELLLGRWAGIAGSALAFALCYAIVHSYDPVSYLPGQTLAQDMVFALVVYGGLGLLYGYIWSCFRNLWVNILLRFGMLVIIVAPLVRMPV